MPESSSQTGGSCFRGSPGVAIIILNWNGWEDTIECLESVLRMSYPAFRILICDNASSDGSMERIQEWAEGKIPANCPNPDLSRLVTPPLRKPLPYGIVDGSQALQEALGTQVLLMPTGSNLGFAGGNNLGLRLALSMPDIEYCWVLNNDTVVEPNALSALVEAMEADESLGICGSVIRDYASPETVLTLGGRRYNRWSGRTRPVGSGLKRDSEPTRAEVDYVEGASMLVRRKFLETVGLMAEDYFLYFEEMDWAMRARGRFKFTYSPHSVVYHKEGGSIGSNKDRQQRSALSDFYQARNRLAFTRRYFPWLLPTMLLSVAATAFHRLAIGRRKNGMAVFKGMMAGLNAGALRSA